MTQLGELQNNYQLVQAKNAEIFAVSVEDVPTTRRTVQREKLTFPVLSDEDLEAVIPYNV
ncbi:redoxin domain-containing protein [Candidatus Poribacteria bacterium]|nr:redoxin domain-containing protein [Candidatus Poribacteria bacterium]